jgi:hypothetical protein
MGVIRVAIRVWVVSGNRDFKTAIIRKWVEKA